MIADVSHQAFKAIILPSGFKVPKFQSFRDSKIQKSFNVFLEDVDPILPTYHFMEPCFLEDIDPIFKILKNLLDGSSGFLAPPFPPLFEQHDSQKFEIRQHRILQK